MQKTCPGPGWPVCWSWWCVQASVMFHSGHHSPCKLLPCVPRIQALGRALGPGTSTSPLHALHSPDWCWPTGSPRPGQQWAAVMPGRLCMSILLYAVCGNGSIMLGWEDWWMELNFSKSAHANTVSISKLFLCNNFALGLLPVYSSMLIQTVCV